MSPITDPIRHMVCINPACATFNQVKTVIQAVQSGIICNFGSFSCKTCGHLVTDQPSIPTDTT